MVKVVAFSGFISKRVLPFLLLLLLLLSVSEICKWRWNLVGKEGSEKSVAYLNWSAVGGGGGLL